MADPPDPTTVMWPVMPGWMRHRNAYVPGAAFTVPPVAIHRVLHAGGQPAVTIHVYSPPLTRTGSYSVGPGGELEREALPPEAELRAEPALG